MRRIASAFSLQLRTTPGVYSSSHLTFAWATAALFRRLLSRAITGSINHWLTDGAWDHFGDNDSENRAILFGLPIDSAFI